MLQRNDLPLVFCESLFTWGVGRLLNRVVMKTWRFIVALAVLPNPAATGNMAISGGCRVHARRYLSFGHVAGTTARLVSSHPDEVRRPDKTRVELLRDAAVC